MIFHFQFSSDRGWEVMGAGEGQGDDPLAMAITDLRGLHGGALPAGHYQYIEAMSAGPRWCDFELNAAGDVGS